MRNAPLGTTPRHPVVLRYILNCGSQVALKADVAGMGVL